MPSYALKMKMLKAEIAKSQTLHSRTRRIKIEAQLHPSLGGDVLKERFEALLEVIQQESLTISKTR